MLTRMKKMLRNEKGFTLVELLAVIVILGIIVAIAVPAIGSITDKAESDADAAEDELILDAARIADLQEDDFASVDTVGELITKGYLEDSGFTDTEKDRVIKKDGEKYSFTDSAESTDDE